MSKDRDEADEWPAELDETIIADLVGGTIARERAEIGRRMLVSVYCRKLNIELYGTQPIVIDRTDSPANEVASARVPLADFAELGAFELSGYERCVAIPAGRFGQPVVACAVTAPVVIFAPFISPGDTVLVGLAPPAWSPAAVVRRVDGQLAVTDDAASGHIVGTVLALWPSQHP
ncbi:MAG TPA: hypothetical protein VK636_11020 [Gemmatimonadaceae bacterium]|nr:hypothetical protein [Gemmatimonadaceae bacterium]